MYLLRDAVHQLADQSLLGHGCASTTPRHRWRRRWRWRRRTNKRTTLQTQQRLTLPLLLH